MTILLAVAAAVAVCSWPLAALPYRETRQLQPYVAPSKLYALHKPAGWTVREQSGPDSFRVLIESPDRNSKADMYWARGPARPDALASVAGYWRLLKQTHPDCAFSEVYVSRDNTRAVGTVRYRSGAATLRGRYYFETRPNGIHVQGYIAPEHQLDSQRPLLLNVLASFAFARQPTGPAPGAAPAQPEIVRVQLVPRRAPDGSVSLATPADWAFLAAGGKVVAGSQDGALGFIFTMLDGNPLIPTDVMKGVIGARYQPPPQALTMFLQALGNRDVRIQSSTPDQKTMAECRLWNRACDAQDILVRWTSAKGAASLGAIKMINFAPSAVGMWSFLISGVWGPEGDLPRYLPMLEQVAGSFQINHQYARSYIQNNLAALRAKQQQTQQAMQDLSRAREQQQRDWEARQARKDYMESKWDDYRRGNTYWVSELEGGKVYQTDRWGTKDTVTGQYYEGGGYGWTHFEGQNPRHPSETMREISSYELQQLLGRAP